MKHKIDWIEEKSPEWKVASVTNEQGSFKEVSINKTSKKGEAFPNFDGLMSGQEVDAEFWSSPAGKHYLFPPRVDKVNGVPYNAKPGAVKAAEVTAKSVEKSQDRKEHSIKESGTQRDAVLIVTTFYKDRLANDPILTEEEMEVIIRKKVTEWKTWLLGQMEDVPF